MVEHWNCIRKVLGSDAATIFLTEVFAEFLVSDITLMLECTFKLDLGKL